ncbi:MAG: hypothetical protein AB1746_09085 [Candidatus Zixiibacteriota bacterium]
MSRLTIHLFAILALTIVMSCPSAAQTKIEFQAAKGFTDNLVQDTSSADDAYTSAKVSVKVYPLSGLEINLKNEYTLYRDLEQLSNFKGDIGFTYLPLGYSSRFSLYINGNFNSTVYRKQFQFYNVDNYDSYISFGFSPAAVSQFRIGWTYNNAKYSNELKAEPNEYGILTTFDMMADNDTHELFVGGTQSFEFLGSNAFDFETGYSWKNLTYVTTPDTSDRIFLNPNRDTLKDGQLKSFYVSPRYSRSMGNKIGLSLIYIYRSFKNPDVMTIPGGSTGFLSPWASVYEGQSMTGILKTFVVPNFIVSGGVGYWDKDFLITEYALIDDRISTPPYIFRDRHDYQWKYFLSVQKPFPLRSGSLIEPALQIDYIDNKSDIPDYMYTNFSILAAVKIKM